MLFCRGLGSKLSTRFYAKKKMPMVPREVDVLTNPGEKYVDAFMKEYGNDRTVFKKEDIAQWQNSFDDYQLKLTFLKDTTKLIAVCHFCTFHPINPLEESVVFTGFGWLHPEYRTSIDLKLQHDICQEVLPEKNSNIISQINEPARKFWHMMCDLKESDDIGNRTADVGYKSIYGPKDFVIPENLDFSGITIRNARDVPKREIIEYDQSIHPYHREKYIISHMYDRDGYAKVAYDNDGKVIGIGQAIIYDNRKDCNLGPLYADNPRVAQAMFAAMLKDIKASEKKVTEFEIRTTQKSVNSYNWISPFLKCQPNRSHVCNLVYKHWEPKNIAFHKVYCPTHAQLFVV